jgi:hypothetical protein
MVFPTSRLVWVAPPRSLYKWVKTVPLGSSTVALDTVIEESWQPCARSCHSAFERKYAIADIPNAHLSPLTLNTLTGCPPNQQQAIKIVQVS